jgi:hypothetical protein
MARDMLADAGLVESNEPLAISSGSPPVSFTYNLAGSRGIYFSGWVWQQDDTNSVLFSFSDASSGTAGEFVSDLTRQELRFLYSPGVAGQVGNATFLAVPLQPNTWMHLALAIFSDNTVLVNIDGTYSQSLTLELPGENSVEIPSAVRVNIARGVSLDRAGSFSGLVRGVAINGILTGSDTFSLNVLQNCTLECTGGGGFCSSGGRCRDLFGTERVCRCPYGITGLRCQQMHDRFAFDGSGFAQVSTQSSLGSIQFSFKTDRPTGEIFSHSEFSSQTQIQLRDNLTIGVNVNYCNGISSSRSVSSDADGSLNDLQYHMFNLSGDGIQLDGGSLEDLPTAPTFPCDVGFQSSVLFGSFNMEPQPPSSFQGCVRDVSFNGAQLDASLLQFSGDSQFGCTRDTVQFHTFSHLELPQFISRESQVISLAFSTHSPTGILYFSRRVPGDATGAMPNDFVAIHMLGGRATFTFNLGEQDRNVVLQSNMSVNDGEWHGLTAVQTGTTASFYIDGVLMEAESTGPLVLLDTTGSVFIGGVPAANRIAGFSNYVGFDGCVRELEQNRQGVDFQGYVSQTNVRFGTCN